MRENRFKKKLLAGEELIGMFLNVPSPIIMEIMHLAGLDFTIIDAEHAPFNPETIDQCVRVGDFCGLEAIIRVHDNFPVYIQRAMDLLPAAIMVPQVSFREDAQRVIQAAYFPPKGSRGFSPNIRFAGYSSDNTPDLTRLANENACVICQVEGAEGIENLGEILSIDGIDAIFIGPHDLSASIGHPGELDHPEVEEKMKEIITKTGEHGKTVGSFCQNLEMAKKWRRIGIRFLTVGVDAANIYRAFHDIVESLRTLEKGR
jgi:4-hydroxy-2-oxoheptanedioate aldolase